jgi:hypothetical protein
MFAEVIPKIYDTPRQIQILGKDDAEKVVAVNMPFVDEKTGETRAYYLTAGKYDVKVTSAASTQTAREEAALYYGETIKAAPQLMTVMGDIYFRNSDFAGADEAADRLKKFIKLSTPGLIDDDPEEGQAPIPPQAQMMLEQGKQAMTVLSGELEAAAKEIETLKSKERIELEKIQVQREEMEMKYRLEMAKLGSVEDLALLREDLGVINQRIELMERQEQAAVAQKQFEQQQKQQAEQFQAEQQAAQEQAQAAAQAQPGA